MNKVLISIFSIIVLTGCSAHYDYYKGGVKYVQEGSDCVYYSAEQGNRFSSEAEALKGTKKVVYRNTLCSTLYNQDVSGNTYRQDRRVLTPATVDTYPCVSCATSYKPVAKTVSNRHTCERSSSSYSSSSSTMMSKRRYVIVSTI